VSQRDQFLGLPRDDALRAAVGLGWTASCNGAIWAMRTGMVKGVSGYRRASRRPRLPCLAAI